jgi:hypothetical protein
VTSGETRESLVECGRPYRVVSEAAVSGPGRSVVGSEEVDEGYWRFESIDHDILTTGFEISDPFTE